MMGSVPPECRDLADSVAGLEHERNDLQAELLDAGAGHKAVLARADTGTRPEIAVVRDELVSCIPAPFDAW
jgi:hypothetical protein